MIIIGYDGNRQVKNQFCCNVWTNGRQKGYAWANGIAV